MRPKQICEIFVLPYKDIRTLRQDKTKTVSPIITTFCEIKTL